MKSADNIKSLSKGRDLSQEDSCFEDLCNLDKPYVLDKLMGLDSDTIVKAYMGTSPQNAAWMESTFENIDFEERRKAIGRIPVNDIEIAQKTILDLLQ